MVTKYLQGTKYYHRLWGDFSSPTLTSQTYAYYINNTNITDVYKVFDGSLSTYIYMPSGIMYYADFSFENPVALDTLILSAQRYNPAWPPSYIKAYAKVDGTWVYLGGHDAGTIMREGGIGMTYSLDSSYTSTEIRIAFGGGTAYGGDGQAYSAYALEASFSGSQVNAVEEITEEEYLAHPDDSDYYKVVSSSIKTSILAKPKYMKKTIVETPWTQPILSANGTLGGSSFAVSCSPSGDPTNYPPYAIFDGNLGWVGHTWLGANNAQNQWVIFYNPIPIKITNLNIVNANGQARHIASGNVYFSEDGTTWTLHKAFTNSNYTLGGNWDIPITETVGHKYWKLGELNYASGSSGVGICEMYITATTQTISAIESTKDDYDFIEYRNYALTKPKYMKKTLVETLWTQPIATLNANLDKDEFSVTGCINAYPNGGYLPNEWKTLLLPPFNGGTASLYHHTNGENPNVGWIFRIPSGVKLQSLDFSLDTGVILYGSYDKSTWISLATISGAGQKHIDLNNTDYIYYKIKSNPSISVGYNDGYGIKHYATLSNVIITATIKPRIAIEGTKEDHTFISLNNHMLKGVY